MFGVDSTEFLIVAVAALIFIGPKDLPRVMHTLGTWMGRARAMTRHFTVGIETMMRQVELEEMELKWKEENERIMRAHPYAEAMSDQPPLTPDSENHEASEKSPESPQSERPLP